MDWLATTVGRLTSHFRSVVVGPPADPREVAALRLRFDTAPEDLLHFYNHFNGITVGLRDDVVGHLFPLHISLECLPIAVDAEPADRFFPIRGDGCGDYDCVVLGKGTGEGSVVFWDHEVYEGPAYLLAGSFSSYCQMWADHLVTRYLADGEQDTRYITPRLDQWPWLGTPELSHPWPFDETWIRSRDANAAAILADPQARAWLLRQDP